MTDVELDARISALEENGGSGTTNGNNRVFPKCFSLNSLNSVKKLYYF